MQASGPVSPRHRGRTESLPPRPPPQPLSLLTSGIQIQLQQKQMQHDDARKDTPGCSPLLQNATSVATDPPASIAPRRSSVGGIFTPRKTTLPSTKYQPALDPVTSSTSRPIPIPARQHPPSRPITPLTAREEKRGAFFPFYENSPIPLFSQSMRPNYSQTMYPLDRSKNGSSPSGSLPHTPVNKNSENSTASYPSSPLSPTMRPARSPKPPGRLQLAPLPRFHPAVYQAPNPSAASSPTRTRPPASAGRVPRSPQHHQRQLSDAQQKLKQYQREILANASLSANLLAPAGKEDSTPKAPHIRPRGSPGPATPLTLEDQNDDYLAFGAGSPREAVDKITRTETGRNAGIKSRTTSPPLGPTF